MPYKGYIALFISFATKAIHVEAVTDLTAGVSIAALRRFSARRGAPLHIYNGITKSVAGASRNVNEIQQLCFSIPQKNGFTTTSTYNNFNI